MKNFFRKIWLFIKASTVLKYAVVALVAVIFIGFVDENSIWNHMKNKETISELESEIEKYDAEHKANQYKLRQLYRDPKAIEKIARERYFMKADDEDIYVLDDDVEQSSPTSQAELSHETAE